MRGWLAIFLAFVAAAFAHGEARKANKAIYGSDGRQDFFELEANDPFRAMMAQSIVALMESSTVGSPNESGQYTFLDSYTTFGSDYGMCSDQKFVMDPTSAFCSGTLVGPDRVVTAGHCVNHDNCYSTKLVFNYHVTGRDEAGIPTFPTITEDDVYECHQVTSVLVGELDYAVVLLDRPVHSSHSPVSVSTAHEAIADNLPLVLIGCPVGLPFKVDKSGVVIEPNPDGLRFFQGTVDAFGGNSGSGVFLNDGTHVGILVRGAEDFDFSGDCGVVNVIPSCESDCGEDIAYAFHAHDVANCRSDDECASGWCDRHCGAGSDTCTGMCYVADRVGLDLPQTPIQGALACGSSVSGNIGDSEFAYQGLPAYVYTVTLPENTASPVFSTCNSTFDTLVGVFDEDGLLLHTADDEGDCDGPNEHFTANLLAPGTYYVGIAGAEDTGEFVLELECTELPPINPEAITTQGALTCFADDVTATLTPSDFAYMDAFPAHFYSVTIGGDDDLSLWVSTCGSQFDTIVGVFDSTGALLGNCDDCGEWGCDNNEEMHVTLAPGTYYVGIAGPPGTNATYTVSLYCDADDFPINPSDVPIQGSLVCDGTVTGTITASDFLYAHMFPSHVYSVTIGGNNAYPVFSTCNSDFNTMAFVFDEDGNTIYGCNNCQQYRLNSCAPNERFAPTILNPGSYYIVVAGNGGAVGTYELFLDCAFLPPINTQEITLQGSLSCFSSSEGTTTALDFAYADLLPAHFYSMTVPEGVSPVVVSTCGSDLDTMVAVFNSEGVMVNNCDECGECPDGGHQERLSMDLAPGTYYIAIAGYYFQVGPYQVALECDPQPVTPGGLTIQGSLACGGTVTGTTTASDFLYMNSFPVHVYSVTIGGSYADPVFSTCNSNFDTMVFVFDQSGGVEDGCDDCGECDDHSREQLSVDVNPGSYFVAITGSNGEMGAYELALECTALPPISPTSITTQGTLACGGTVTGATTANDFSYLDQYPTHFYSVTIEGEEAVPVVFSTCGSQFDTMVGVFSHDNGAMLNNCDDCGECEDDTREQFHVTLAPGSYYLGVTGSDGETGTYEVKLECNVGDSASALSVGLALVASLLVAFVARG